jgi:hypothetical protein
MSEAKHTPGPWSLSLTDSCLVIWNDGDVASTFHGEDDYERNHERREADARLIAAAPDGYDLATDANWDTVSRCIEALVRQHPESAMVALLDATFDVLKAHRAAFLDKAEGK